MTKRFFSFIFLFLSVLGVKAQDGLPAQEELQSRDGLLVESAAIGQYTRWTTVELNGKLSHQKLPLNPSVKIFMEKGNTIMMSVRAPIMGEVIRLEVYGDSVVAVNKMKKLYATENISGLTSFIPVTISDIQDMLLARVFLLNQGTLSAANGYLAEMVQEENEWLLIPRERVEDYDVEYGFVLSDAGMLLNTYATTTDGTTAGLISYSYNGSKTTLDLNVIFSNQYLDGSLTFDAPTWNATAFDSVKLNNKYTQVTLAQILKSF